MLSVSGPLLLVARSLVQGVTGLSASSRNEPMRHGQDMWFVGNFKGMTYAHRSNQTANFWMLHLPPTPSFESLHFKPKLS